MMIVARLLMALLLVLPVTARADGLRGTGNLGLVIERATGSVVIVDTTARQAIGHVEGLGDLSHASVVFSPDQRYAYVFGRDGGLTKVDLLTASIAMPLTRFCPVASTVGLPFTQPLRGHVRMRPLLVASPQ